jgi:hypothetical protein
MPHASDDPDGKDSSGSQAGTLQDERTAPGRASGSAGLIVIKDLRGR